MPTSAKALPASAATGAVQIEMRGALGSAERDCVAGLVSAVLAHHGPSADGVKVRLSSFAGPGRAGAGAGEPAGVRGAGAGAGSRAPGGGGDRGRSGSPGAADPAVDSRLAAVAVA